MSGSLPSRETFASQYRSLAVGERGSFISDLRAARGWETAVEGAIVVAERDGTVRRIAVDQPDEDTAVDAVVAADERLRSIAENHDAEVLEPGALRDELFYALDTQKGTELFGAHFGDTDLDPPDRVASSTESRDPQADDRPGLGGRETASPSLKPQSRQTTIGRSGTGTSGTQTGTESQRDDPEEGSDEIEGVVSLATVLTAGVVFLLLLVLASGSGAVAFSDLLSGGDGIETADPDPTSADGETEIAANSTTESDPDAADGTNEGQKSWDSPAGTQGDPPLQNGTRDADQIAETHAAAMKNYDSFRFRVRSEGPADAGAIDPPSDLDVRIIANNQFMVEEEDINNSSGESVSIDVFADGYLEYWRFDGPAGVRYNRGEIRMAPTVIDWSGEYGADLIRTYLNASETTVQRDYVDNPIAYRIIVDSPPPALAESAVNYRAAATVMSDGSVQTLTVSYRHEPSGEQVWLRLQYDIGEPEIGTPIWYDRALEQFDYGP